MSNFLESNWNKNIGDKFPTLIIKTSSIKVGNKRFFIKYMENLTGMVDSDNSSRSEEQQITEKSQKKATQQFAKQLQKYQQQQYEKDLQQQVSGILKKFKKGCFIKIAQKSAKDLLKGQHNLLLRNVRTYQDFCNILITSDYLIQHVQLQTSQFYIIFRQYIEDLETQSNHYRVYIKSKDNIVGICQKYPNHFEHEHSYDGNILKSAIKIASVIQLQDYILELFCDAYGNKFLLGVEPLHISSISLFSQQMLDANLKELQQIGKEQFYKKLNKITVREQSQLKQQNMDEYKMTNQLDNIENAKTWLEFLSSGTSK